MRPEPGEGFVWIDREAGPALVCRAIERLAPHLFTTRPWRLGSPTLDARNGAAAWDELAAAMNVDRDRLSRLHQVHGTAVVVRKAGQAIESAQLPHADIVVSTDPSLAIAIQTADCVPILIVDEQSRAVAAAHAGWRGLAARVPSIAVTAITDEASTNPDRLHVAIGPAISAARYEVGRDVRQRFESAGFAAERIVEWFPAITRPDHWLFDGVASARDQLVEAGVRADRIYVAGLCTATFDGLLCSYRRDGARAGRMAAAIRARAT